MTSPQAGARKVVLDASAVLAWVQNERGARVVDQVLPVAVAPVSVMVETLYRAVGNGHRLPAAELFQALLEMGLQVESVTTEDAVRAAELIAVSRASSTPGALSLGDGLCIAVAERLRLPITGGDEHWETVDLAVDYIPFR